MKKNNFFLKNLNFNLRIFLYKALIVFLLSIFFFKLTVGDKISKIDNLIKKAEKQIDRFYELSYAYISNPKDFKNKIKDNLNIRLQRDYFFNDQELLELIIKSKIKIYKEIESFEK